MSEIHDRLESWKAIAEYLDHDTTTVARWAKERGLPVYSVPGGGHRRRAVYAYKTEINAWLRRSANQGAAAEDPNGALRNASGESSSGTQPASHPPTEEERPRLGETAVSGARFRASLGMTRASEGSQVPWLGMSRGLWVVVLGGTVLLALGATAWLRLPRREPRFVALRQLTEDGREKGPGLATDGARVYFIENGRDGWGVAQVPTSGGSPAAIAKVEVGTAIQDISPDRTELLLVHPEPFRPGPVWTLRLQSGTIRRLGAIQAYSAAWSPDGAALAYASDDGLYVCDASGSNSRRIVVVPGTIRYVHWSPDGRRLCLARFSSNRTMLWEVDRDGTGLRRMIAAEDPPWGEAPGFWTPDGNHFIFQKVHDNDTALWVLRRPSGLLKRSEQLTRLGPTGVDFGATTMDPERWRFYGIGSTKPHPQMQRLDAQSKQFAPFLPDVPASAMDFTKDGQWIAYVDGHRRLWRCRNDGSERVQLTLQPLEVELPRWSPDGKSVAFMGQEPGQPWKVRVVSAEGGPYGPVTATDAAEGAPTWSPEGTRLVFGGLVDPGAKTPGPLVIHVFDLRERRLSVVPGSQGLWTARWSPDGRYIAALTEDSSSLVLFDWRSGKWTKLLSLGRIGDLRWSRQGKCIYLTAVPRGGEPALFRVKIASHQVERLIGMASTGISVPLGLAPDDSPLVMYQIPTAEIYAFECQFPK